MSDSRATAAQSGWHRLAGDAPAMLSVSFGEAVRPEALRAAWERLAQPALGCGFRGRPGGGLDRFEVPAPEWRFVDWSAKPPAEVARAWSEELDAAGAAPADLSAPIRSTAFTLPDGSTHWLAVAPRFLMDEEGWFLVLCDLLEALDGHAPAPRGPAKVGPPVDAGWWRDYLTGLAPGFLPCRVVAGDFDETLAAPDGLFPAVDAAARRLDAGRREVILAMWALVLARVALRQRVPLLTTISPPGPIETGANVLPFLPPDVRGMSLADFVRAVAVGEIRRARQAEAPLDEIGLPEWMTPGAFASFVHFPPPPLNARLSDALPRWINLDARLIDKPAHHLELEVRAGAALRVRGSGLPAASARVLLERLVAALEFLAADASRPADALPPAPVTMPEAPASPQAVPIEAVIAEHASGEGGGRLAIEDGGGAALTFAEADEYASHTAAFLLAAGLGEGWVAGICLTPSPWVPVAWLGALRAGNTILAMDPDTPPEVLAKRAEDCDVEFFLCDSGTLDALEPTGKRLVVIDREWEAIAATPVLAKFPASAKTGLVLTEPAAGSLPPLNVVPSPALSLAALRAGEVAGYGEGDRVAVTGSPGTGAYAEALLGAMAAGATAVLDNLGDGITHARMDTAALRHWIEAHGSAALPSSLKVLLVDCRCQALDKPLLDLLNAPRSTPLDVRVCASPCDFSALGLHGPAIPGPDGTFPAGDPARTARILHSDASGREPLPGFVGTLSFQPPGVAAPCEAFRAWRAGGYHLIDEQTALLTAARRTRQVTDAALGRGKLWIVGEASLDAIRAALDRTAARLPAEILRVPAIPRRHGKPDLDALDRPQQPHPEPAPTKPPPDKSEPAGKPPEPAPPTAPEAPAPDEQPRPPELSQPTALPADTQPPLASAPPAAKPPAGILLPLDGAEDEPLLIFIHGSGRSPYDCSPALPMLVRAWRVAGIRRINGDPPDPLALARALHADLEIAGSPLHLFGVGTGGLLAFETVRHLRALGHEVPFLVVAGTLPPQNERPANWLAGLSRALRPQASLYGPCGIVITADLPSDAESRWLQAAPDALCRTVPCRTAEVLTTGAEAFVRALNGLAEG